MRSAYEDTKVYKTFEEFVQKKEPNFVPNAFVIGSPPMFRGTKKAGKDVKPTATAACEDPGPFVYTPSAPAPAAAPAATAAAPAPAKK